MKYKWLNHKNNEKIIVFFNGWGMDESVVRHLSCDDFDVIMFYDYNNLDVDFDFKNLKTYTERYLVSWSMGVMCATLFADRIKNIDSSIAINGTLRPIDNEYGIPEKIYGLTLKNFSQVGRDKFIKNMFIEDVEISEIAREFENQKSELYSLKNYKSNESFKYDKVIISDEDKIIPTKNQVRFWNIEPNLHTGHCPFFAYKSWSEIL